MTTLSDALRKAALERAHHSGEVVDGVILEPDGVIDLRTLETESLRGVQRSTPMLPTLGLTEAGIDLREEEPPTKSRWRRSDNNGRKP